MELVKTRVAPTLVGRDATQRNPLLADLSRVLRFAVGGGGTSYTIERNAR